MLLLLFLLLEALLILLMLLEFYESFVGLFGLLPARKPPEVPPQHRFAIFIPAHNEEAVIGFNVRSLLAQDYPRELFDIFVIADNCTDRTAEEAEAAGAQVLVREGGAKRGKPAALNWAFAELGARMTDYDAVCVIDADNVVGPNFLRAMNARLARGERIIQAYLDTKNPEGSWISGSIALAYWSAARTFQLARARLGLCAALGGTGVCIATELLARYGWNSDCLTEDLEFQARALADGYRTSWAHEAHVYDEKPLTLKQSWRQRLRWMRGHIHVAWLHGPRLLREGLLRMDWAKLDTLLYLLQPLRHLATFVLLLTLGLAKAFHLQIPQLLPPGMIAFLGSAYLLHLARFHALGLGLLALIRERIPLRAYRYYLPSLLFGLTWVPIIAQALVTLHFREWTHTRHQERISIAERLAWAKPTGGIER